MRSIFLLDIGQIHFMMCVYCRRSNQYLCGLVYLWNSLWLLSARTPSKPMQNAEKPRQPGPSPSDFS